MGQMFTTKLLWPARLLLHLHIVTCTLCQSVSAPQTAAWIRLVLMGLKTVFGVISVIAAAFLGDISKYMDDHVAVVIE
jgi:hypothetical protein